MNSFIATVEEVFALSESINDQPAFCKDKKYLSIPLYQREYKWDDKEVITLVKDIDLRDKLLGIIILNESKAEYEIVDGQQRITTLFLVFIALYNQLAGQSLDQKNILDKIYNNSRGFVLRNYSLSKNDFIGIDADKLKLIINRDEDQFYQKEKIEHSLEIITIELERLLSKDISKINGFIEKLLKCRLLILLYDQYNGISVEQVFLDINEKSKLLEPDEIFKGHCFKKYSSNFYELLRKRWEELKKCSAEFSRNFGFKDLSQYIYLYLLENENPEIDTNLKINGEHVLDSKSMTSIDKLMEEMVNFGKTIIQFSDNLNEDEYCFSELIFDAETHKNDEQMHRTIKVLCKDIIGKKSNRYQKLPFFYLIYNLTINSELKSQFSYADLKKAISSLYIYTKLFAYDSQKKTKADIDRTVNEALKAEVIDKKSVLSAIYTLRKGKTAEFNLPEKCRNSDKLMFFYSVVDFYDTKNHYLSSTYNDSKTHIYNNLEHLIIPENTKRKIKWVTKTLENETVSDITKRMSIDISEICDEEFGKEAKKSACDYIIINKTLNNKIRNYDIVTKLYLIEKYYRMNGDVPKHISYFIERIRAMKEYQKLVELKDNTPDNSVIISKYNSFLEAYFNRDESEINADLNSLFQEKFNCV